MREKIRNVISLEISGTKLGEQVLPPRLVRDIDWVEKFWPDNRKGNSHPYPKVQLYCLMGVGGAWTVSLPASIDVSPIFLRVCRRTGTSISRVHPSITIFSRDQRFISSRPFVKLINILS